MRRHGLIMMLIAIGTNGCGDAAPVAPPSIAANAALTAFPDVLRLPPGFSPEGIAFGRGSTFYVGSIFGGAIFRGDALTGAGSLLVQDQAAREHVGMKYDERNDRLIVAGGTTGQAYVYDASTGATLAIYQLGDPNEAPTLINDVALSAHGAYFTDSFRPVLYYLPLPPDGTLPLSGSVRTIPLSGDFEFVPDASVAGNANGISLTPNGRQAIIVNTTTGRLSLVDLGTGHADDIELTGGAVEGGDGILLIGQTLYVVQGPLDQIAVVRLNPGFTSGEILGAISDTRLRFPSTAAAFGSSLYVVNARFADDGYPEVDFEVVRVGR